MDWTAPTMSLPRAANFAAFCGVVVGMIAVEVAWSRYAITTDARNHWQMIGFVALVAFVVAEAALRWYGEHGGTGQPRRRGFSIFPKDDHK